MKLPCVSLRSPLASAALAVGLLFFGLTNPNEVQAAPTFQAAGTAVNGTGAVTPAWPTHAVDDIALLFVESAGGEVATLSTAAGFVEVLNSPQATGTATNGTRITVFWARATSTAMASPTVADPGNHVFAQIITYRNVYNSGNPWDVTGGGVKATASTSVTVTGVTTTVADTLVVQVATRDNDANGAAFSAQTNTNLTGLAERSDDGTNSGNGGGFAVWDGVKAMAGATGDTTATVTSSINAFLTIALKPVPTTTLGNGTDPVTPTSLNPGDGATVVDAFTFKTNSGTDSVSAVVVGFATGTAAGLSRVEIINNAETTVYGEVIESGSGTSTITDTLTIGFTTNISVDTTETQYKIRITPKSHPNMPTPPGTIYNLTAKINSWTGSNLAAGSDTAGLTIAIDNQSSSDVTGATGTSGNGFVNLSWTNPGDAASVLVLRSESTVETPTEGTSYTAPGTLGTSTTIVCSGLVASCNDNSVENGKTYSYKIYTRDSIGNYSVGVAPTGSPYTPAGPGCYSVATGNWGSSSTWADSAGGTPGTCPGTLLGAGVPDSTTPVYINFTATSHTVTVNVSNAQATSVRIGTPGTGTAGLAMSSGTLSVADSVTLVGGTGTKKALLSFATGTLKLGGSITESGATDVTFGTGTVEYNGTGAQTVTVYGYYNLTINKSAGTATTAGNITIGNDLTLTSGTLNIGANSIDRGTAGGILTLSSGSTLQIGGGAFPANYSTVSIAATSTVEYNPGYNINIPAPGGGENYGNLVLSNSGNRNFAATMTVDGNLTASGTVALAMNAGITVNGALTLGSGTSMDAKLYTHTVSGNFTNNGTFTPSTSTVTFSGTAAQAIGGVATSFYNVAFNNSAGVTTSVDLSISGNFTNTAGFGAGSTTTTFNGTAAQAINGPTAPSFYNLTLSNSAGLTMNVNSTVGNVLTFSSGRITTGTYTLILSSATSCGVSGAGSGKYVIGKLRKSFNTTTPQTACDFEVGDSYATTHYTPVNVSFSGVSGSGTLTVAVKGGSGTSATADDHPQIADSGLDSANSLNRYWMLVPTGGFTFSNATLTFTHLNEATWVDHDNTANVGRYAIKQFTLSTANCYPDEGAVAGSWSTTTATGTQTVTSTAATGISTFGTNCSHFAIGRGTVSSFLREKEFIFQREVNY